MNMGWRQWYSIIWYVYEYCDIHLYGFINNSMDDIILILSDCRINDTIYALQIYKKKHITICLFVNIELFGRNSPLRFIAGLTEISTARHLSAKIEIDSI